MREDLVVLIPAFNAETTLPELITRPRKQDVRKMVVVDDGSKDKTAAAARNAGVTLIQHEVNRGKGAALRSGFSQLKKEGDWNIVVTMDADLQHRPEDLPLFVEAQFAEGGQNVDMIVGHRRRWGTTMPLARIASNTLTSLLVSAKTGLNIKDSQCGYRLIRRSVVEHVSFTSNGYEAETEFLIGAARQGYSISFVPIQTVYNDQRSYMTHWETTKRFVQVLMKEY